ncbi:hypothetical protein PIB30_020624 [Stylosanthes scabra]|uniref:Uncharacterized protein n=1 Tax=Stylosanthes scabra TaxID=79078 RepID=A0ABU6S8S1_9FABA|nr:hypothetical protein [Stylosanthes scabra]
MCHIRDGEAVSQHITHVESQSQYSASDELSRGDYRIVTLEDVYIMPEETRCWVSAEVVSIEVGDQGWCYAACTNCKTKMKQIKNCYVCDDCGIDFNKPPSRPKMEEKSPREAKKNKKSKRFDKKPRSPISTDRAAPRPRRRVRTLPFLIRKFSVGGAPARSRWRVRATPFLNGEDSTDGALARWRWRTRAIAS